MTSGCRRRLRYALRGRWGWLLWWGALVALLLWFGRDWRPLVRQRVPTVQAQAQGPAPTEVDPVAARRPAPTEADPLAAQRPALTGANPAGPAGTFLDAEIAVIGAEIRRLQAATRRLRAASRHLPPAPEPHRQPVTTAAALPPPPGRPGAHLDRLPLPAQGTTALIR